MARDFLETYLNKPRSFLFVIGLVLLGLAAWGVMLWRLEAPAPVRPVILLINRYPLTPADKSFLQQANPYGFLLGIPAHPHLDPRRLRQELAEVLHRADFVFFIDQEGGTVNRIKQYDPSFQAPAPEVFGKQAETNLPQAIEAAYQYGVRTGKFLKNLTIDVVFAPLAEQRPTGPNAPHKSRYFSDQPALVQALADAYARGLADGGVIPCYKHAPGGSAQYEKQTVELPALEIQSKLLLV
ncbi:glycoside hydrolase family 3 N-terminal domain-containing protein [Candidatus Avelusimicrobium gallicola]|uniref:Glycoside hydrolase family 3 N-terminal domain-containing protein n=1 Tax=Candidatus Avelusimicrobium gallicola TaxID=2562704 RepID=A0A1Y4DQ53_9BACT|nr:glycoside hydrolase family 3 N-terminal domain-containing protein [Elusimicrobium sp. An273]OUO57491.1 hypothetical protein B5F75_01590 [Elusimicrobium sp. An273]